MTDLRMEALDDLEAAEVIDQGLASLNARFTDPDELRSTFPGLSEQELAELANATTAACDAWDRFADLLPGFRVTR